MISVLLELKEKIEGRSLRETLKSEKIIFKHQEIIKNLFNLSHLQKMFHVAKIYHRKIEPLGEIGLNKVISKQDKMNELLKTRF